MKKIILILAFVGMASFSFGQAARQLNIGFIGVSYEIPVATDISIAPAAGTNWSFNYLYLGVKANYYFDNLVGLTDPWDFYAGLNAGYALGLNSYGNDFGLGAQIGGRWFWSDKWGVYLEAGGGNLGGSGGVGVTMKM